MSESNRIVRAVIQKGIDEGKPIENQLGYYRLIKFGLMKGGKLDEAKEFRELDKECQRMLKEGLK